MAEVDASRSPDTVLIDRHDGWATITLNRPHRKNALTGPSADALAAAIRDLGDDPSVAAIVIAGADGAFCSGVDLKEMQADPRPAWVASFGESWRQVHLALFACGCPVIGALERFGINAGAALAFGCDLLIAGESSFLQVGEIRQGAAMPMNAAWLRLKTTEQVMARLALLGDRVVAGELHRLGLVTEVVGDDNVIARAEEIAATLANHPEGSARTVKASIRSHVDIDPDAWFQRSFNRALESADLLTP